MGSYAEQLPNLDQAIDARLIEHGLIQPEQAVQAEQPTEQPTDGQQQQQQV